MLSWASSSHSKGFGKASDAVIDLFDVFKLAEIEMVRDHVVGQQWRKLIYANGSWIMFDAVSPD